MKLPNYMRSDGNCITVKFHSFYFGIGFVKWFGDIVYMSLLGTIFTYEKVGDVSLAELFDVQIYQRVGSNNRLFGIGYLTKE